MFSDASHARSRNIAMAASIAWHAAIGVSLVWVMRGAPPSPETAAVVQVDRTPLIVFLDKAGVTGGGGGGGNNTPAPAQRARRPGADRLTVPVATPPDPLAMAKPAAPEPETGLQIPALNMAAALDSLPGTIQPTPGPPAPGSLGPGSDNGAGGKRGTGDGRGPGDGLGDGGPRGAGGGPYRIGAGGVTPPIPLYRGTPRYTPEAVQARTQGSVLVECIVQPTGRCTDFRVVRSIQPPLGLDREAVAAAGEWRFKPGTFAGEQVPVLVTIEVAFAIR
jgi:periplasmic protein TonB